MAITVTRARVKEKCGIADTTHDATIDNLIAELSPVIQATIAAGPLADAGLAATLNLGATEVVCGEFLAQLHRLAHSQRPEGTGGCDGRCFDVSDPSRLIAKGWRLLRPYLKVDPPFAVPSGVRSGATLKAIPPEEA